VPAAAVIPAPIAYIKAVAVKKPAPSLRPPRGSRTVYLEEIRAFKAGSLSAAVGYVSMG